MSGYFKYLVIFSSTLIEKTLPRIILDPVTLEIFEKPRSYRVPNQTSSVLPLGANSLLFKESLLQLDGRKRYLELIARTKEKNPEKSRDYCEAEIDKLITSISLIYGSQIFSDLVYRGWLIEGEDWLMERWVKFSSKTQIDEDHLARCCEAIKRKYSSSADISDRFNLMSRMFVKALAEEPSEEKFIWLWTILEIFPMKNTTNIKPISTCLGEITEKSPEEVKEKLGIGTLYQWRCDLVHNGKWDVDIKIRGEVIAKLEDIVCEILRHMVGLPYADGLGKYFD